MFVKYRTLAFLFAALVLALPMSAGIVTTGPVCLPPLGATDGYTGQFHTYPGYVLSNPVHAQFTGGCNAPPDGGNPVTVHSFGSMLSGDLSIGGNPPFHIAMPAQTTVQVQFGGQIGPTQFFQTEMLQLDITGAGLMIRESPTLASTGSTEITDLGGGLFRIDSFFDVFTELSIDGGQSWLPSDGSTRMTLTSIPEPTTMLLFGAGLAVLVRKRRK